MNISSEDTSLVKIEALEQEYQVTLSEYQQAYQTYINSLQQGENIGVSNYNQAYGQEYICSMSPNPTFPDGNVEINTGFYPADQCAALCDENPYCAGYNLNGPNDSNGNPSCTLFANPTVNGLGTSYGQGCYTKKNFVSPTTTSTTTTSTSYGIIGIGTDGLEYIKSSLTNPWQRLNNDSTGDLIACATDPVTGMYFVVKNNLTMAYKNSYTDTSFIPLPYSNITDFSVSPDGLYVVLIGNQGTVGQLWYGTMNDFMNNRGCIPGWNPNQIENSTAVAINPEGMVFTVGGNQLYTKPSYLSLTSTTWTGPLSNSCCMISITFAPDGTLIGVGTDHNIYSKPPDNGYTNGWSNDSNGDTPMVSISSVKITKTSTSTTTNIPTQQTVSNNNALAEFVSLPGKNYWGSGGLKEGPVSSLQDCETMCASDLNCTGATFQSDKNYCYTRTGEGNLVAGSDTDYALIPEVRQSLLVLNTLNKKLLDINQQIRTQIKSLYPIAKEDQAAKNEKQRELNINYAKLLGEHEIIKNHLKEYGTLEQEYENNTLMVNQHNIILKFWSIFALILLAITFKVVFNIKGSSAIFLIITVLLMIIFLSLDWWSLLLIVLLPLLFKLIYYPS